MDSRADVSSSLWDDAVIKKQGPRECFANFFTLYCHHDCPRKHWFAFLSSQHMDNADTATCPSLFPSDRATSIYMDDLVYLHLRIPWNTLSCINRWRERNFLVFLCLWPQGEMHFANGPTAPSHFAIKALDPEL